MKILIRIAILTAAVLIATNVLKGVSVNSTTTAIIVAIVFGLLNVFVQPILQLLALPITVLTLGIFYLVINVFIVYLTSWLVSGFNVDGFLPALFFSIIVSLVSWVLGMFLD